MSQVWFTRSGIEYTGKISRVIDENNARYLHNVICNRCGGTGGGPQWAHTGWKCYKCGGARTLGQAESNLYSRDRLEKLKAAAEKRRQTLEEKTRRQAEKHAKKIAAIREEFEKQNPGFSEDLKTYESNPFLEQMSLTLDQLGHLSERQLEVAKEVIQKAKIRKQEKSNSRHVGDIGERIELSVTTKKVISFESFYGTYFIVLMHDASGNIIVYKGSSLKNTPKENDTATIKATVKKHDEYKGEKQTVINRPKIL